MSQRTELRNVAIIAHVDHGKTTLVDQLLHQSGVFRENEAVRERVMDNRDQEQERGITIASKTAALLYQNTKINLVDTPGHSDFGGEVERVLNMVDGALLLVDASEGPQPQTRFVLDKAIQQDLNIVLCVNKIDRDDARLSEVVDEVFELFLELGASDEQLDFPILYTIATEGVALEEPEDSGENLKPIFQAMMEHVEPPSTAVDRPLQMLVSDLSYSDYMGRLGIGRVQQGQLRKGENILVDRGEMGQQETEITGLYVNEGLGRREVESVPPGELAVVAGSENVDIGDTITSPEAPQPLPRISVEEPTVGITIKPNSSPVSGQEGEYVTARKLLARLQQEARNNVAIQLDELDPDHWQLRGRGQLQLAIVLENMRREGYEMMAGQPEVLTRERDGQTYEPIELVSIDVPEEFVGAVTEKLGSREGEMESYETISEDRVRLEFTVPTRGLIGYRSEFQTDTRGSGIISSSFEEYKPLSDPIARRNTGALISDRAGQVTAYALHKLKDRGRFFVEPKTTCYEGMIVGENAKKHDLDVNITKQKQLTNFRAAGSDDSIQIEPPKIHSLESALEWVEGEELVEITPENIRLCAGSSLG